MADKKPIHLTFQVLNFLDDNPLPDQERLVLLEISRHDQNIFDIFINQIAKNCGKSPRTINYILLSLVQKELIIITPRKGKTSFYTINLTKKLSTTHATGCTTEAGCTTATHCATPTQLSVKTPATSCATYNKYNNKNNKKQKHAREARAPLSLFSPTQEQKNFCIEYGIDCEKELVSFKAKASDFGNLGLKFDDWLRSAVEYKLKKPARQTHDEPKSAIKFWGPGHADWERQQNWKKGEKE